jgi:hypothetical protein
MKDRRGARRLTENNDGIRLHVTSALLNIASQHMHRATGVLPFVASAASWSARRSGKFEDTGLALR